MFENYSIVDNHSLIPVPSLPTDWPRKRYEDDKTRPYNIDREVTRTERQYGHRGNMDREVTWTER